MSEMIEAIDAIEQKVREFARYTKEHRENAYALVKKLPTSFYPKEHPLVRAAMWGLHAAFLKHGVSAEEEPMQWFETLYGMLATVKQEIPTELSTWANFAQKYVKEDAAKAASETEDEHLKRVFIYWLIERHRARCAHCSKWALTDYQSPGNVSGCIKDDADYPYHPRDLRTHGKVVRPMIDGYYWSAAIRAEEAALINE